MLWKFLNQQLPQNKEEIIKIVLANRNLKTKKDVDDFINPPSPETINLKDLGIKQNEVKKAIKRIKQTIKDKKQIIVYGDYDADGISGTAILWEVLYKLGANVMPYIPSRVDEGYGLSEKGIINILQSCRLKTVNCKLLIITVDHGIVANKQVEYAKKKGIEIIITDHHVPPEKLPKALATIHTTRLSGSGVAWILTREIVKNFIPPSRSRSAPPGRCPNGLLPGEIKINNYLDLAAIGSIADLIPLTSFNRTLVKSGLIQLNKTKRLGLLELIKDAGLTLGNLGNYEIGFIIAPRLNAMGRLEHALDSLRLLCTTNQIRARQLAQKLGLTNRERQELTGKTTEHAKNLTMRVRPLRGSDPKFKSKLIFISHESYNQGVIGLVAGKLVETFYRPAVVVAKGEKISKASARSINGFNIIEAIRKCSDLLIDCGGHPMAAGFTIETKNLEKIKEKLEKLADKLIPIEKLEKELKIDCEIKLANLSFSLYEDIQKLQPFGIGNPEPTFLTRGLKVTDLRLVGRDQKHLKLRLDDQTTKKKENLPASLATCYTLPATNLDAIGFNLATQAKDLKVGDLVDVVYTVLADEWNGNRRIQLKIKDIYKEN